ncbi:hypothetical protein ACA910_002802 [Epithemia clementina (nom. ined.)]
MSEQVVARCSAPKRRRSKPSMKQTVLVNDNSDGQRPKRPLCAYNIFFQEQRKVLLANRPVRAGGAPRHSHGKMGFAEMAKTIGAMWKALPEDLKVKFQLMAQLDKARYEREMAEWESKKSREQDDLVIVPIAEEKEREVLKTPRAPRVPGAALVHPNLLSPGYQFGMSNPLSPMTSHTACQSSKEVLWRMNRQEPSPDRFLSTFSSSPLVSDPPSPGASSACDPGFQNPNVSNCFDSTTGEECNQVRPHQEHSLSEFDYGNLVQPQHSQAPSGRFCYVVDYVGIELLAKKMDKEAMDYFIDLFLGFDER